MSENNTPVKQVTNTNNRRRNHHQKYRNNNKNKNDLINQSSETTDMSALPQKPGKNRQGRDSRGRGRKNQAGPNRSPESFETREEVSLTSSADSTAPSEFNPFSPDPDFGFVQENLSTYDPPVVYGEDGAPAPVDFDYIPGKQPEAEPTEEEKAEMTLVIGVKFRNSARSYYFSPGNLTIAKGTAVIVETARGLEYGVVSFGKRYVKNSEIPQPLREIIRIATDNDTAQHKANLDLEEVAFVTCKQEILKHGLNMKLIEAQYTFDNAKLLFYFSSDGRVDFRELVKDLASIFHTRIELRQIGIRDEARLLGGLGACGRQLCCAGFLLDFAQVSIKMAKEQNLSLNSSKISGCCGRLLCCLHYEHETYEQEIAKTPPVDSVVQTADGIGIVSAAYPLAGTVRVTLKNEKGETIQKILSRDDVTVLPKNALSNPSAASQPSETDEAEEAADEPTAGTVKESPDTTDAPAFEETPESATDTNTPQNRFKERQDRQDKDHAQRRDRSRNRQERRRPRQDNQSQRPSQPEVKDESDTTPTPVPVAVQRVEDELDGVVKPTAFIRKNRNHSRKRR